MISQNKTVSDAGEHSPTGEVILSCFTTGLATNRTVYAKQTPNANGTNQGPLAVRRMGGRIGKNKADSVATEVWLDNG